MNLPINNAGWNCILHVEYQTSWTKSNVNCISVHIFLYLEQYFWHVEMVLSFL